MKINRHLDLRKYTHYSEKEFEYYSRDYNISFLFQIVITELTCVNMSCVINIPKLDNLKVLFCAGCDNLISIPQLNSLVELNCSECTKLTNIPQLNNLLELHCNSCDILTNIPKLNNLKILNCIGSYGIEYIPDLPFLDYLDCDNCPLIKIENIGYLPRIKYASVCSVVYKKYPDFGNEFIYKFIYRFTIPNSYRHKLRLIKPDIEKIFEKSGTVGFTDDFIRLLEKHSY